VRDKMGIIKTKKLREMTRRVNTIRPIKTNKG
jgi:hypothetical protein